MLTLTFAKESPGLRVTLCPLEFHAKYKRDCSVHVEIMGRKSSLRTWPLSVTLTFVIGTWGLRATLHLTEVNIHAKYKQGCLIHVKVMA